MLKYLRLKYLLFKFNIFSNIQIYNDYGEYMTKPNNGYKSTYWIIKVTLTGNDYKFKYPIQINFKETILNIGCKVYSIDFWDLFFNDESVTMYFSNYRNSDEFKRIKSEYLEFRKFLEKAHKIIYK